MDLWGIAIRRCDRGVHGKQHGVWIRSTTMGKRKKEITCVVMKKRTPDKRAPDFYSWRRGMAECGRVQPEELVIER